MKLTFNFSIKFNIAFLFVLLLINNISAQDFVPGTTYYDSTGFVEYRAGNLPIILSAPHGGNWEPDSIPDRDCPGCSYSIDSYTRVITWGLYDEIFQLTGCYPHLIMNRLHRIKFDANRDIGDAADGNPLIEQSWYNYHDFIDIAKARVTEEYERGIFFDIHGHGHTIQRIELGYLLSALELSSPDSVLNSISLIEASAIRSLVGDNHLGHTHSDILRGPHSFGSILHDKGFPSVPSTPDPYPTCTNCYFSGGYNTVRHGSRDDNGPIDAIQVELDQTARNSTNRSILIDSLASGAIYFVETLYGFKLLDGCCPNNVFHDGVILDSTYIASKVITSSALIEGNVIYKAGESITLDSFFNKPFDNKIFEIIIEDCGN